jgi:short-subunit dehydrogenase
VEMADLGKDLRVTVAYKGKPIQLTARTGSTLGQLGQQIVDLTGVAPHTLRLIIPKRPPVQPLLEQHSAKLLSEAGITEVC